MFRRAVACDSAQRIVSWIACHRAAGCQARSRRSCSPAARFAESSAEFSPSPFVVCVMSGDLVDSRSLVGEPRSASAVVGLRAKQADKRSYPRHRAHGIRRRPLSDRPRTVPDRPPTTAGLSRCGRCRWHQQGWSGRTPIAGQASQPAPPPAATSPRSAPTRHRVVAVPYHSGQGSPRCPGSRNRCRRSARAHGGAENSCPRSGDIRPHTR